MTGGKICTLAKKLFLKIAFALVLCADQLRLLG